jgi:7,8-dihydropterin-6-yl-methyl-4-(beta-D-ribofuranosyl)aminobenzene 5'-phosphate synthase
MKIIIAIIIFFVFILLYSVGEDGMTIETDKINVSLVTIYDNYQVNEKLKTGWGFSCLIRTNKEKILFDTGADSGTLLYNMEEMGLEAKDIDAIVLSHIHGDHTGGLFGILEKKPAKVYALESFPGDFKNEIKSYGSEIVEVSRSVKIADGIYTTGELGTWLKEQSLIINTEKGLVVITGCAHPGIVNIVKEVKGLTNEDVYLVLGGFHLSEETDPAIRDIIKSLRELGVKKIAPCHCSGDRARELFKEEYRDDFISNGVGKIIEIG